MLSEKLNFALKVAAATFSAFYGFYATVTDFRVEKDGKKALSRKGYMGLSLLVLATVISISSDRFKENLDKDAAKKTQDVLDKLNRNVADADARLKTTGEELQQQVEQSAKISGKLTQTEAKLDATGNRIMDPFSRDIRLRVDIWIPNHQPLVEPYLRRLARQEIHPPQIHSNSKLFPDSTIDEESQLTLLTDLKVIEVEFPSFREQGSPRMKFYAYCGPHGSQGAPRPIDKWIVEWTPPPGLLLTCSTLDVEWYSPLTPELRSFQDLSAKEVIVGVDLVVDDQIPLHDLIPPDRSGDTVLYLKKGGFPLNYEILSVSAETSTGRGFSSELRKQPCEKPWEILPCFVGRASAK